MSGWAVNTKDLTIRFMDDVPEEPMLTGPDEIYFFGEWPARCELLARTELALRAWRKGSECWKRSGMTPRRTCGFC